jgi:hypothetical protein
MLNKLRDTLAMMGFLVRSDPPRGEARDSQPWVWGLVTAGLSLSARPAEEAFGPAEVPTIYAALRNASDREVTVRIPDWPFFVRIRIFGPGGQPVQLTPYGRAARDPARNQHFRDVAIEAGKWISGELPVGALYEMREPGEYRVSVACRAGEVDLDAPEFVLKRLR